ncbi:hypothetical protein V6N11_048970 [Hibiscus sabdariffa]|uniref:Uncharacterized protein n=1 Tax=Hibiscus sabdariffa TaxID=183260 RepID=A0ABR2PXH9_9ROSI
MGFRGGADKPWWLSSLERIKAFLKDAEESGKRVLSFFFLFQPHFVFLFNITWANKDSVASISLHLRRICFAYCAMPCHVSPKFIAWKKEKLVQPRMAQGFLGSYME